MFVNIKPQRLKKGDIVGVIAPASPPDLEDLERGIRVLESMGLKVVLGKHIEKEVGYLAGSDYERLEDFHSMFKNNEIKAILCARGGYGSARIASFIDYELIKKNPKIFLGFSDITFLHIAIGRETGLTTFHGPMVCSTLGQQEMDPWSNYFFQSLFEPQKTIYTEKIAPLKTMVEGIATGPVIGGNLTLLTSTLGTQFELETTGKLLVIEEIEEEPRAVDRMLNQLYMAGKLEHVSGLLIGDFHDCLPKHEMSLSLDEVLNHYVNLVRKPTLQGFKIGHCTPNILIPLGVTATINTFQKSLEIEAGVM